MQKVNFMENYNEQNQGYQQYSYQQSGYQQPNNQQLPPPENHLAGAIVATVLCCPPFGIPAIVNAARVNSLWASGNHQAAVEAANAAHKWMMASIICGLVGGIIYIVLYVSVLGTAIALETL